MTLKFTINKIILTVIPYSLIYFLKKRISINYLLFGKAKRNIGNYLVNDANAEFTLYNMETELGTEVVNGFQSCFKTYRSRKDFLRKYVLEVDNCFIEPKRGWGILANDNSLVYDSISNNTWREAYHPSWLQYKKGKDNAACYSKLISINLIARGETNYWHFLHDLLGEIALAKKLLPGNIPFLISKTLATQPFFRSALLQSGYLAHCTWVIRDDRYYKADKAWFIQTMPNSNEQFFDVRKILGIQDSDNTKQKKIFLKRNEKRIRFIKNNAEIETIARQYNFEVVDADNLSLQQQIELFGETKFLVGTHGAGLTNVLFRKNAPLHLLELLPQDYLQPHYFWLSKGLGHKYSCIVGSSSAYDTSFYVEPKKFEEKLSQILRSSS